MLLLQPLIILIMLHRSRRLLSNLSPHIFKNVYYRTANKAQQDLYDILGVSKNADAKDIKKAYYKLAQQHHPDKNPSPEAKQTFTKINNAYEVLSDPSKRQQYDQTGSTEEQFGQQQQSYDQDFWNQFTGGFGNDKRGRRKAPTEEELFEELFGGGFRRQQQGQRQPEVNIMTLTLSFEESVSGCTKQVEYERMCTCAVCKGSKSKPGSQPQKCRTCGGSGMQTIKQGMFIMKSTCGSCGGEGEKIKQPCGQCRGAGVEKKRVVEEIQIPRGIKDGMTIQLSKKGNFDGDLLVKIGVRKSRMFTREGNDAYSDMEISVLEAVLGAEVEVSTIQGKKKKVKIPQGSQPGDKLTLKNEGFYTPRSTLRGNHYVSLKVSIPKSLTAEQVELYHKIRQIGK